MMNLKKICSVVALSLALGFPIGTTDIEAAPVSEIAAISINRDGGNFQYWNNGAASKAALMNYVKDVTNLNSKNFIPVSDRIAVFDMDGTFYCETAPTYSEWALYLHRVLEDSSYTPTNAEKAYAQQCLEAARNHSISTDMDKGEDMAQAYAFEGMTLPEFNAYVDNFMKKPLNGLSNITFGEAYYLPMVEIISYLNANNFTVYVVTGTDRQLVRECLNGVIPIEANHVIGTDSINLAENQSFADGMYYTFSQEDKLVRGPYQMTNNKMNKVCNIAREIGKQPVLGFGNSSSDASMLQYVLANNKYKSMSFGVVCDDDIRDFGGEEKSSKFLSLCEKNSWVPISMKNDWKTIYGDEVTKTAQNF